MRVCVCVFVCVQFEEDGSLVAIIYRTRLLDDGVDTVWLIQAVAVGKESIYPARLRPYNRRVIG